MVMMWSGIEAKAACRGEVEGVRSGTFLVSRQRARFLHICTCISANRNPYQQAFKVLCMMRNLQYMVDKTTSEH